MKAKRRTRLIATLFILVGTGVTVGLVLVALNENINMFYPPDAVVSGEAPLGAQIRAGGMVADGSVRRNADNLDVAFVLTDYAGSEFEVRYSGILPDLFREGQGVIVAGALQPDGVFRADQVLAKHDENYMPPELADMSPGHRPQPEQASNDR